MYMVHDRYTYDSGQWQCRCHHMMPGLRVVVAAVVDIRAGVMAMRGVVDDAADMGGANPPRAGSKGW